MSENFLEDIGEFFAPSSSDAVDLLIGQYNDMRKRIEGISAAVDQDAMRYFLDGNGRERGYYHGPSVDKLFQVDGAVAALNSAYWSKAMHLTDVLDAMPQKRRDEWNDSIRELKCPEFTEDTVRSTMNGLLNMRHQFLSERVDGIFFGLSNEHVTNAPQGFGKRMIIAYVLNCYGSSDSSRCGLINDLRAVIAKFMGRDEPRYSASSRLVETLKDNWGQWVTVDGGALKIRLYKKGTAHMEIHPDMAWRLNAILAHLHPMAIPAEFRVKPKRKAKDVPLMQRPLPFAVINVLAGIKPFSRAISNKTFEFGYGSGENKHAKAEAIRVIESIGGVIKQNGYIEFDYNPTSIIDDIINSGCIPDSKSHQFYPTPENVARAAVELAEVSETDICLEPSAGIGGLADFMPKENTHCVEISELRCNILKEKGFTVTDRDFLKLDKFKYEGYYDRIVMNPPYDQSQWKAHVEHAAGMVAKGGRLVAILPNSAKDKFQLNGFNCSYPQEFHNEFAGTSISVVILVADRV